MKHATLITILRVSRGSVFFSKEIDQYSIPFMGADPSVVKRTQRFLLEAEQKLPVRPPHQQLIPYLGGVLINRTEQAVNTNLTWARIGSGCITASRKALGSNLEAHCPSFGETHSPPNLLLNDAP